MTNLKNFFKGSDLGKIIATIIAFLPIVNLLTSWFSSELFLDGILRIILFIVFIFFWIPGIIASIYWIWFK